MSQKKQTPRETARQAKAAQAQALAEGAKRLSFMQGTEEALRFQRSKLLKIKQGEADPGEVLEEVDEALSKLAESIQALAEAMTSFGGELAGRRKRAREVSRVAKNSRAAIERANGKRPGESAADA